MKLLVVFLFMTLAVVAYSQDFNPVEFCLRQFGYSRRSYKKCLRFHFRQAKKNFWYLQRNRTCGNQGKKEKEENEEKEKKKEKLEMIEPRHGYGDEYKYEQGYEYGDEKGCGNGNGYVPEKSTSPNFGKYQASPCSIPTSKPAENNTNSECD